MAVLQEAGLLDTTTAPSDEVFHSEIKEPDFEALQSFHEVGIATGTGHVTTGSESYGTSTIVNRSMLPALPIFDTVSSVSHSSKEQRSLSARQTQATSNVEQVQQSSSGLFEQRETTPFSVQTRGTAPSGQTAVSSIEPIEVQERKKILDFDDLHRARQEGQLVGIGARHKVRTFASPALDTVSRQKSTFDKHQCRKPVQASEAVNASPPVVSPANNGEETGKPVLSSSAYEKEPYKLVAISTAFGGEVSKPITSSPPPIGNEAFRQILSSAANKKEAYKPRNSTSKPGEATHKVVIRQRTKNVEPESERPTELHQTEIGGGKILRDNTFSWPRDTIGRSLSEPAQLHQNGSSVSPWARQSSSNSQRSVEVEQEYRSLIDGKHLTIIRSRELPNTDFSGFKGLY